MHGEVIRTARRAKRLTQVEVAWRTGIGQAVLSQVENDIFSLDRLPWGILQRLCVVLDLSPADLRTPQDIPEGAQPRLRYRY